MLSYINLSLPHLFPTFIIDYYHPIDSKRYMINGQVVKLCRIHTAIFNTRNILLIAKYLNNIDCSDISFSMDSSLLLPVAKLVNDEVLYYMLQYVYKFLPSNRYTNQFVRYAINSVELTYPTHKFFSIFKHLSTDIDIPTLYDNNSFEDIDYILSTGYKVDITDLWKLDYRNEYILGLILESVYFVAEPHEHQLVYCMLYEFVHGELPRWAPNLIRQARCVLGVYLGIKHNLPYYGGTVHQDRSIIKFLDKRYDIAVLRRLANVLSYIPPSHCLKAMSILIGKKSNPLLLDDCNICQLIRAKYMESS